MRLIATGDWQLGTGADYGTPERARLDDQIAALLRLGEIGSEASADVLLHAGDVFQHRRPVPAEYLAAQAALEGWDAHVILGNHDVQAASWASSVHVLGGGVRVYERPQAVYLGGGCYLGTLPWAHPSSWRAVYGHEGTAEGMAEALTQAAAGLRAEIAAEVLPSGEPPSAVLLHHYGMAGFSLPNGLAVGGTLALTEPVLDPYALAAQGWDYVIGGHVQRPEYRPVTGELGGYEVCHVLVVGSPYVCDFGEAHYDHGAWLIDTARPAPEFVPLPDRRFLTLDWTAEQAAMYASEPPAPEQALAGAVVRARITCTEEEARGIDTAAVRRALLEEGAHKVYAVTLDIERGVRRRAEEIEAAGPEEALEEYLRVQEPPVSPERAQAMREEHSRYLKEEAWQR